MKKRGISPVIATVLLIALVIAIALILFLWFKNLVKEPITKEFGTNIELVCNELDFDGSYSSGRIYLRNNGNIPIYNLKIIVYKERGHETIDLNERLKESGVSSWPDYGLTQGGVFNENLDLGTDYEKIIFVPVLLGKNDKGDYRVVTCQEKLHGIEAL